MAKKDTDISRADALEKRLKEAEKRAKKYEKMAGNGLSVDSLKNIAGEHADPKMLKQMEKMQKMAANPDANLGDMVGMAAQFGDKAGLSDKQQEILKAIGGGMNEELDLDKASSVPGLVVDKNTGKISVLGLFELDAKDPTSKMIAGGISAAYSGLAVNFNEIGFREVYKHAAKAATKFDLTRASNSRIGTAAAIATVAGTSFWPDVNNFIRQEKQNRKNVMSMANDFAPLLDDYMPGGGSRVAKLYQVTPETNQMIVNERKRLGVNHGADRFKSTIDAFGRLPLFAISMMRGHESTKALRGDMVAEADIAGNKNANESAKEAKYRMINEEVELIKKKMPTATPEQALDMARDAIEGGGGSVTAGPEGFWGKMSRDMVNGGVMAAVPVVSMLANNLYNKRKKDLDIQPISATDMVNHLGKQIDDDPKAERFTLPKDMSVLGSKNGNNQLKLEDYLEQLFRQHERDTNGSDSVIPARYEEQLRDACKHIASALREGRLDGRLALFKLVGEQQIVRSGGKFVADDDIVKDQITLLESDMQHMEYVDREKYFAESSFTPDELKQSWDGMDAEEREVFSMMVPAQVLESVGVAHNDLRLMRESRQENFTKDLAKVSESLVKLGGDTLKKIGATNAETSLLHEMAKADTVTAANDDKPTAVIARDKIRDASHAVTNLIVASHANHDGHVSPRAVGHSKA